VQITVVAYVDVAPAADADCPGCDGEFTAEDQDFAQQHALPPMTFIVANEAGQELDRAVTTELTIGIQRTLFTLPAGPVYSVRLGAVPDGWQLCGRDEPERRLVPTDFTFGTARAEYHFTQGCTAQSEANAVTAAATASPAPSAARPTSPSAVPATKVAPAGARAAGQGAAPVVNGAIKGFACVDADGDGQVGPDDPGLAGVEVELISPVGSSTQVTPPEGSFAFAPLAPGTYEVVAKPGEEWRLTTPQRYKVNLAAGQVALGNDFCMVSTAAANGGPKLPATGHDASPARWLVPAAALALAACGALGFGVERRRRVRV
jgi:hypothetical protein